MDIQRVYEKVLNIGADEMFAKNLDDYLLEKLRQKYNGKCENFTFIKDVKSIVKRSMVQMVKDQLDGSGKINVQFLADAVVYEEGSIIVGCEIKTIEKTSSIACEYNNLMIFIKANPKLRALKLRDKIIVQVLSAGYAKEQNVVSIYGQMFFCPRELIVFRIQNVQKPLSVEEKKLISEKLEAIKQVEKVKTADKKMWAFFSRLFYPFKEEPDPKKSKEFIQKDMIDFTNTILSDKFPKNQVLFLTRHPMTEKSRPDIYSIDEHAIVASIDQKDVSPMLDTSKTGDIQVVRRDMFSVIMEFLKDYYSYLKMLQDILVVYQDNTKYKNLWKIYQDLKV